MRQKVYLDNLKVWRSQYPTLIVVMTVLYRFQTKAWQYLKKHENQTLHSRIDRQNILNNEIAIEIIREKFGFNGILWEGKMYFTREMAANFFEVDMRTISRYLEQYSEENCFL